MSADERCGPLTLTGADRPDMATLTTGTVNFGDDVFQQPAAAGEGDRPAHPGARHPPGDRVLRRRDGRAGRVARRRKGWSTSRRTTTSSSASPAALGASEPALDFIIGSLPPGSTWTVAGVGRHQLPMAELAAAKGGNGRVGPRGQRLPEQGRPGEGQLGAGRRGARSAPGRRAGRSRRRSRPASCSGSADSRVAGEGVSALPFPGERKERAERRWRWPRATRVPAPVRPGWRWPASRAPSATTRARWRASPPGCAPARSAPAGRGRAPSSSGPRRGPGPQRSTSSSSSRAPLRERVHLPRRARLADAHQLRPQPRGGRSVTFAESSGTKSTSPRSSSAPATWKMRRPAG